MQLHIFTTHSDLSLELFINAAKKLYIPTKIDYYENTNIDSININIYEKIILRDPRNTGIDYNNIFTQILHNYKRQILLDRDCYVKYPKYEDKLFQTKFFSKYNIPHPLTIYKPEIQKLANFPYIIKKRISSRNKGNYLVNNLGDIKTTPYFSKTSDYIWQEKINIKQEYRVLIFQNQVIGYGKKRMVNNKLKIINIPKQLPTKVAALAIKISSLFRADFTGIDLCVDINGFAYAIEINLSPQFLAITKLTGINPAHKLLSQILLQIR